MFHMYKALGAGELISRIENVMESENVEIMYPTKEDFIDFETMRKGPII